MKKIEQFYNSLLLRQTQLKDELLHYHQKRLKAESHDLQLSRDIMQIKALKSLEFETELKINTLENILDEYKLLYSQEIEVIDGYCVEFKVK